MNITVVHMKHTGIEVICDVLEMNDKNMAITIKDPQTIATGQDDQGNMTMGFQPFLMNCKDNVIHLALSDVLFIAEAEGHIAEQYEQMFSESNIITPDKKIII